MNIILVGFMGTGKSTIAKELGRKLGLPVSEMDEIIVREAGKTIPQIFEEAGEEGFRALETQTLKNLLAKDGQIISGGGGVILKEENRILMKKYGHVVRLTARPETVYSRVYKDTGRPNLKGRMSVEGIAGLMEQRREAYEAAQEIEVATDEMTPARIAGEICRQLKLF